MFNNAEFETIEQAHEAHKMKFNKPHMSRNAFIRKVLFATLGKVS